MGNKYTVVIDDYTAAFLTSVLERIKSVVGNARYITDFRCDNTKYTTFFVKLCFGRHHDSPPVVRSNAAPIKPMNKGCALLGLLLNSG